MVVMKRYIKILALVLLFNITVIAQEPKLECTKENLLLAIQKAAKQLPEVNTFVGMSGTGKFTFSSSYLADKYTGLTYQQILDETAKDKEKEAKEARELADRERTRVEDIRFIRKMIVECKEIK